MDISVDFLNRRLAAQLPNELPLGLIFVVGRVSQVWADDEGDGRSGVRQFELVQEDYRLRCLIPPRAVGGIHVAVGDKIRAGGHLTFDQWQASYVLVARDVEHEDALLMPDTAVSAADRQVIREALADTNVESGPRRAGGANMPQWVEEMAPVRAGVGQSGQAPPEPASPLTNEHHADMTAPTSGQLPPELVTTLAAAIDSSEDVELTPDMLAAYSDALDPPTPRPTPAPANRPVTGTETAVADLKTSYRPPVNRQETDWLVIIMLISFVVMTIAVIVATVLLLLR